MLDEVHADVEFYKALMETCRLRDSNRRAKAGSKLAIAMTGGAILTGTACAARAAAIVFLLVGLGGATVAKAQIGASRTDTQPRLDRPILVDRQALAPVRDAAYARLRGKVVQRGEMRVIVELDLLFADETASTPADEMAQVARLRAEQDSLLRKVLGRNANAKHAMRFEYSGGVAVWINARQLDRLVADTRVVTVQEDVPLQVPSVHVEGLVQPRGLLSHISQGIIRVPNVWKRGFTGLGRTVVVIGTGVDKRHGMFAGDVTGAPGVRKIIEEACFSTTDRRLKAKSLCPDGAAQSTDEGSGTNCPSKVFNCDHGTRVASVAAGNPFRGYQGVAFQSSIFAIKAASKVENTGQCPDAFSDCATVYLADALGALNHVYALRAKHQIAAVDLNLTGALFGESCDAAAPQLTKIFKKLKQANIPVVVPVGETFPKGSNTSIAFPSCISTAVAVGSSEPDTDSVSSFSNFGNLSNFVMAPGAKIPVADVGHGLTEGFGTSLAAPHVVGILGLLGPRTAGIGKALGALLCGGTPLSRVGVGERPRVDAVGTGDATDEPDRRVFNFTKSDLAFWKPWSGQWSINNGVYEPVLEVGTVGTEAWQCYPSVSITAVMHRNHDQAKRVPATGFYFNAQQSGGLLKGYLVRYETTEFYGPVFHAVAFWKMGQTGDILCQNNNVTVAPNAFNTLTVVTGSGKHEVYLNGQLACSVEDDEFPSGTVVLSGGFNANEVDDPQSFLAVDRVEFKRINTPESAAAKR